MADPIKVKSKKTGAVKDANEIFNMLPQESRVQGEDANAFASRLAKEYPDQYEIATTPAPPSIGGFVSNLGSDVKETVKGLASLPGAAYDLAATPYRLYKGETTPESIKNTTGNIWDSLKAQYKEYYGPLAEGNFSKFGSNVYEHPGQILNDIATAATAGEAGAALAGAKQTARALGKVAAVTDPITAGVKTGQQVSKATTKIPAVDRAVTKAYQWGLDQNLPKSVLTDKAATEAAKAKNLKTAEAGLKYGIRLDKQGAKKAASVNETLHGARAGSVQALPQTLEDVKSIIDPDIQKIILGESNNIGSNARDIESVFTKQAAEEIRGADVIRDAQGNISGNKPFLGRSADTSRTINTVVGEVHPAMKTSIDMMESIKKGNLALQDIYDSISKTGGMEHKTKAMAQKSIIESYRSKLNDLVGDVPITFEDSGKTVTMPFKDIGIDQSKLINLGQEIHEAIFNSNPFRMLSPKEWVDAGGFFGMMKDVAHTPQTAARIAVFVKGTNPSTMAKTRVMMSAGHLAPKTQKIPRASTPWDNEINDHGTPWDNEIKK